MIRGLGHRKGCDFVVVDENVVWFGTIWFWDPNTRPEILEILLNVAHSLFLVVSLNLKLNCSCTLQFIVTFFVKKIHITWRQTSPTK